MLFRRGGPLQDFADLGFPIETVTQERGPAIGPSWAPEQEHDSCVPWPHPAGVGKREAQQYACATCRNIHTAACLAHSTCHYNQKVQRSAIGRIMRRYGAASASSRRLVWRMVAFRRGDPVPDFSDLGFRAETVSRDREGVDARMAADMGRFDGAAVMDAPTSATPALLPTSRTGCEMCAVAPRSSGPWLDELML